MRGLEGVGLSAEDYRTFDTGELQMVPWSIGCRNGPRASIAEHYAKNGGDSVNGIAAVLALPC